MKKVFYKAVLSLSSLCLFAQNKGADTSAKYAFMGYWSGLPDHPLIVLNDKISDGNLADLKVKLKHIEIYKGPGVVAIFGVRAANGVIIMGTKNKLPMYFSKPSPDTSFVGRAVYIIDGELSDKSCGKEQDILIRSTTQGAVLDGIYERKLDSIVIITSRKYAVEQYQKKFSSFSEYYKKFIFEWMKNNHKDDGILYIVMNHSDIIFFKGDGSIRNLYNIPTASIAGVSLTIQQTCCGTNRFVTITTKN